MAQKTQSLLVVCSKRPSLKVKAGCILLWRIARPYLVIVLLLLCLDLEITKRFKTLVFGGDLALLDVLLVLRGKVVDSVLEIQK